MAYDEILARRVSALIFAEIGLAEKKMFGGIGFLVHGNMACGVVGDGLVVRVGADRYRDALAQPHARVFDMTGRPMSGWVLVEAGGLSGEAALRHWVDQGLATARSLPPK